MKPKLKKTVVKTRWSISPECLKINWSISKNV
jgi:hypothetical protein